MDCSGDGKQAKLTTQDLHHLGLGGERFGPSSLSDKSSDAMTLDQSSNTNPSGQPSTLAAQFAELSQARQQSTSGDSKQALIPALEAEGDDDGKRPRLTMEQIDLDYQAALFKEISEEEAQRARERLMGTVPGASASSSSSSGQQPSSSAAGPRRRKGLGGGGGGNSSKYLDTEAIESDGEEETDQGQVQHDRRGPHPDEPPRKLRRQAGASDTSETKAPRTGPTDDDDESDSRSSRPLFSRAKFKAKRRNGKPPRVQFTVSKLSQAEIDNQVAAATGNSEFM